ncbi:hypothetical protein BCV72DRAFT_210157, partial [Rhizopus microsporus var. microsporus]
IWALGRPVLKTSYLMCLFPPFRIATSMAACAIFLKDEIPLFFIYQFFEPRVKVLGQNVNVTRPGFQDRQRSP